MIASKDLHALPLDADAALAAIVDRISDQLEQGQLVDEQSLLNKYPEHAARLHALLPTLRTMARFGCDPEDFDETRLKYLGEYQIVGEIGRGGMGIVYRARQPALDRDVALKVLPPAALTDRQQLIRFENEARAAAALQHRHIVPVFAVGRDKGIHYYAMRYIAGPTLAQVLQHLRCCQSGRSSAKGHVADADAVAALDHVQWDNDRMRRIQDVLSSITGQISCSVFDYYRQVARWGIQAASALAHAHEHGVVHRDIKPANLLLEHGDHIWVTDFGLARLDVAPSMTGRGNVLGTLRYMSPEQVAGGHVVDHRTDIYSLGSTFYEALTLQPVFGEQSRRALARQIQTKPPPPPRRIQRTIPADLETIVLKALEKDPAERYETAMALADDLQRFLDGRPLHARPVSTAQRLRKWAGRHVAMVTAGLVALLLFGLTASMAAVFVWRASQRTQVALAEKSAAIEQANQQARLAHRAVDQMYGDFAAHWIAPDRALTATQRRFLQSALTVYQQIYSQPITDATSREEVGQALLRGGDVLFLTGQREQAIVATQQAIAVLEPLSRAEPEKCHLLQVLHGLYSKLAERLFLVGRLGDPLQREMRCEQSLAAFEQSAAIRQRLAALEPDETRHQHALVTLDLNRCSLLAAVGRRGEAELLQEQVWQRAWQLAEQNGFQEWEPSETALRAGHNWAKTLSNLRRHAEAELVARQAVAACETWARARPADRRVQSLLGNLCSVRGSCLLELGQLPEAEATLRESLAAMENGLRYGDRPYQLFQASWPDQTVLAEYVEPELFLFHARTQIRLGQVLHRMGRDEEAVEPLNEATLVLEQMVRRYPDAYGYQLILAQGQWELARLRKEHDPQEAEQRFRRAAEIYGGFDAQDPRNHVKLAQVRNNLGCLLVTVQRHGEARALFDAAIEHVHRALELRPDVPRALHTLNRLQANLALLDQADSSRISTAAEDGSTLHLKFHATILGSCRVTLHGNSAVWEHWEAEIPHVDERGQPQESFAVCRCGARIDVRRSDLSLVRKTEMLDTELPRGACEIQLSVVRGRGQVQVLQHPSPDNDETLIIAFNNVCQHRAAEHEVLVEIQCRRSQAAARRQPLDSEEPS